MNGAAIVTKFENMVDDVLDSDFVYQLLNDAKDEIEAETTWLQLLKETSYTVVAGYSFTSALGALPTRFVLDVRVVEDNSNVEYEKVGFDDRVQKENNPLGYFLDIANGNFYLSGQNHSAKTIYLYYTDYSADITSATSWVFPSRFHLLIPLKMAELYFAADAGEKARAWDDRWANQFERILAGMHAWNDQLKVRNRRSYRPQPSSTPKSVNRVW